MITAVPVRSPATYLGKHLIHADYYSEEETVEGEWMGKGAERLKLGQGEFASEFAKIGKGEAPHPAGDEVEKIIQRVKENAVSYRDLGISAPKDFSVLAMLGEDERLSVIFKEEVKEAVRELEGFSARRFREGTSAHSKEMKITGNLTAAVFIHQSSRLLEPQLHAHVLVANATFDEDEQKWFAQESFPMMKASVYVRERFYHRLAHRIEKLGYRTHGHSDEGFEIRGIEHLRDRFSNRTAQIEASIRKFRETHGRDPGKDETQRIVLATRDAKLKETTAAEIRQSNLAKLTTEEIGDLAKAIEAGKHYSPTPITSAQEAVERGMGHQFERQSITSPIEVLKSAYRLSDGLIIGDVQKHLSSDKEVVFGGRGLEMTHQRVLDEERQALAIADRGVGKCPPLGTMEEMEARLGRLEAELVARGIEDHKTKEGREPDENELGQIRAKFSQDELREVAKKLLLNSSRVSVLIGDAGTGKTFGMNILQDVHLVTGGERFSGLAPTGLARKQLEDEGTEAQTIQRFLLSEKEQENAAGKTLLLDEAGLVGTAEMAKFLAIAERIDARVVLVGDTKQHDSVTRGSALRNLTEGSKRIPVARLATVRRQSDPAARRISELMASGNFGAALEKQASSGQLFEIKDEDKLFETAAKAYVDDLEGGKQPLVVIPTWSEIEKFTEAARLQMAERGLLEGEPIEMMELKSLSRTDEERGAMKLYKPGDVLLFHKEVKGIGKDAVLRVRSVSSRGLETVDSKGKIHRITRKQRKAFDVMKEKPLSVAKGDRIMLKANLEGIGLNGEIMTVKEVDQDKGLTVEDSKKQLKTIPVDEKRLTHGHAITSHRSQGQSRDSSIAVMGKQSIGVATPKQYYVSNTRYKSGHRVFVADRKALSRNLAKRSAGLKLGREMTVDSPARSRVLEAGQQAVSLAREQSPTAIRQSLRPKRKFSLGHADLRKLSRKVVSRIRRIQVMARALSLRGVSRLMEMAKGRSWKPGEDVSLWTAKEVDRIRRERQRLAFQAKNTRKKDHGYQR